MRKITHKTSIPNQNFFFCAYFWLKLEWDLIQKIPSWEIWHITIQFQNQIFSILCFFLAEISMKFHWKKTLLWNDTHNTSIPNQIFSILCLFLAEISLTFHSKDTSLRNMTCNSSIQNHNFMSFSLLLVEIEYEISFKWYLLEKYDTKHFYSKSKFSQFCAYFWLKLEWNFIEKRPSGGIRHITLLFKIIISSIFA